MALAVIDSDIKWNAVNLPIIYKVTNTKFPVNSEDPLDAFSTVTNNAGFAQITLDAASTFIYQPKGSVKITGTTSYNGVWKIRSKTSATVFTIDAPFVATESGTLQNYYNNYNTLVRVYAGLPEYHPGNVDKPMTLITDNPITITPNASNEAIIDVSALVKSKMNLDNDYTTDNDLNPFTAFFIEYSEQYDQSNGVSVEVITEAYETNLVDGCDPGAANFVTNGDFATDLSEWTNEGTGADWVYVSAGEYPSVSLGSNQDSKQLTQVGLGLTLGTEYRLSFFYDMGIHKIIVTIRNGTDVIFQEQIQNSGTLDIDFIAKSDSISFEYKQTSNSVIIASPSYFDDVSITNILANPCIDYRFAVHNALQPQNINGGNLTEYVQEFGDTPAAWLTLFEQPVLFEGNYFDISTLIPQSVIQSAIQSGGYFLEIVELNRNNEVVAEQQVPITNNLGDGVYRFRLDDKGFNELTKKFTVQILRIPVNLFVDGDQGTFDATTQPSGNPPSDWNLETDASSEVLFENVITQSGAGALFFQSRQPVPFIMRVSVSDGETVNLPFTPSADYDFTVDWGDGSAIVQSTNYAESHVYSTAGQYDITVRSETKIDIAGVESFPALKTQLINIKRWGDSKLGDQDDAFADCVNMDISASDVPDTSAVRNHFRRFINCTSLVNATGSIGDWDMSQVGVGDGFFAVANMFFNCPLFDIDLSNWNVENIDFGGGFLSGGEFSTANYDALLISWAAQNVVSGVTWDFGTSKYTLGGQAQTSRNILINTYGWTINDGGGV